MEREALAHAKQQAEEVRVRKSILDTLKSSVLEQAEKLVDTFYGLEGDGAKLTIVLEEDMGRTLAAVSYYYDQQGRMANQHLHISVAQFRPDTGPNGVNGHYIENDRMIAHEMTHAVMGRNMDIRNLPTWFMEGTAEYVAGGAERVGRVLKQVAPQALLNRITHPWEGDNTQYAAGYLAVRYLDQAIERVDLGAFSGAAAFLEHLRWDQSCSRRGWASFRRKPPWRRIDGIRLVDNLECSGLSTALFTWANLLALARRPNLRNIPEGVWNLLGVCYNNAVAAKTGG